MAEFAGRTALVTGSGTGIGLAIATRFVEEGASVIILGRRSGPLEEAARLLESRIPGGSGARVLTFPGVDVADEAAVTGMFDRLEKDGVTVDYMINNAGVSGPVTCFANAPAAEFGGAVAIHLTGTFWGSVQALRVMKKGGRIITISTFFTEERPLEQRPYRFRSPYTAAQGAKNRLAECMSWELVERGIISIATNPGPVHSDRIYKTVYPKAAAEFMRVSGYEDLEPAQVEEARDALLECITADGIDEAGVRAAAERLASGRDPEKLAATFAGLLSKIKTIAEKVQNNTSHMIANREFLEQSQVADTVLTLCGEKMSQILNGKVIPGDRVFYPVKPVVGTRAPGVHRPDLAGGAVVFTVDGREPADADRVAALAARAEECGGRVACFVSRDAPADVLDGISARYHSHSIDLSDPAEVRRWLNTARANIGDVRAVVHVTGGVPDSRLVDLDRAGWDALVARFVTTPATVAREALEHLVPGGGADPRLYRGTAGTVVIVGPGLPAGRKISGEQRARVEVFRGALRPFTATVNQELADVLKSDVRLITVLPGSVTGAEPDPAAVTGALDYALSGSAARSSEVIFCVDETR